MHRIVRHASGVVAFADEVQGRGVVLAQFSLDNRGLWLQVAKGIRGIHVNGRPVRRMAWLRVGDAVYADGVEMLVIGIQAEPPDDATATLDRNCLVLRGVGGRHYGRSFTLEKPRIVGQEAGLIFGLMIRFSRPVMRCLSGMVIGCYCAILVQRRGAWSMVARSAMLGCRRVIRLCLMVSTVLYWRVRFFIVATVMFDVGGRRCPATTGCCVCSNAASCCALAVVVVECVTSGDSAWRVVMVRCALTIQNHRKDSECMGFKTLDGFNLDGFNIAYHLR